MPPVGFEPMISAGKRPQIYALDCAATGTSTWSLYVTEFCAFLDGPHKNVLVVTLLIHTGFNEGLEKILTG
jgi:hypothetical protein